MAYLSRGLYMEGLIFGILRYVATDMKMLSIKYIPKIVSVKSAYQKTGGVNNKSKVAFILFAIHLLLSIYIFATYLQGANLCKSIFSSRL